MYSKIAIGNIKKSFKDYTIYFITLSFAVCIFYAFNSIGSQEAMIKLSTSQASYIKTIEQSMSVVSVFVSVILGALIIYANNFLIKKRKKELGIYTTLGMGKGKISRILVLETFIVGIISLVIGLVIGLIISQGLSAFTAKLFVAQMSKYTFIISSAAIIKTIIYFGIIFILVMIFNTIIISKYKLIDLLTAGKKNENIKVENPIVLLVIFILGVLSLCAGYYTIVKYAFEQLQPLVIAITFGVVGTFLFFYGLSGFVVLMIQKNKKVYLKGLNIFVTKQMNNKINTNFVSMALISLMLFITITALSTGVSFKNSLASGLKENTPFFATIDFYGGSQDSKTAQKSIDAMFKNIGVDLNKDFNVSFMSSYSGAKNQSLEVTSNGKTDINKYPNFMTLSDYNKNRKLKGEAAVTLEKDSVIITSNVSMVKAKLEPILETGATARFNGKVYKVQNNKVENISLENSITSSNYETVIIPDDAANGLEVSATILNMNKKDPNKVITDGQMQQMVEKLKKAETSEKDAPFPVLSSREGLINTSEGITSIILYITIYLGIIFLITSAAVLALQQLLEASDSIDRYKTLRKIGVSNKMINKSIFKQILIHFSLPLGLALIDSAVAICVISKFIAALGESSILVASLATAGIIIVIYGGYMYSTYVGFKNVVKE